MRCGHVRGLTSRYLDGELDDRQMSAIRGHLRQCEFCEEAVADELALIGAAEELAPVDPPPSLWEGISARLAEEEIADASRSRLWFWWSGVWRTFRPYAPHLAGASLAAAVLGFVVLPSGVEQQAPFRGSAVSAPAATAVVEREFEIARGQEIARADARYRGTIEELLMLIEEDRGAWEPERARAFEAQLAEFELQAAKRRQVGLGSGDVFARDELHAVYREQIDYLSEVALAGVGP